MLIQLCGLPHVYFSISQRMHALNNLFILNSLFQHITLLHEKIFRILKFKCWTTHTNQLQGPKTSSGLRVAVALTIQSTKRMSWYTLAYIYWKNSQILNWVSAARVKSHTFRIVFPNCFSKYTSNVHFWYLFRKLCRFVCLGSDSIWRLCWRLITFPFLLFSKRLKKNDYTLIALQQRRGMLLGYYQYAVEIIYCFAGIVWIFSNVAFLQFISHP